MGILRKVGKDYRVLNAKLDAKYTKLSKNPAFTMSAIVFIFVLLFLNMFSFITSVIPNLAGYDFPSVVIISSFIVIFVLLLLCALFLNIYKLLNMLKI